MAYADEYQFSLSDPEGFWASKAEDIPWIKTPKQILAQDENEVGRWFVDGEMNTCYAALDWHVQQGRGDNTALIYDSPVTQTKARYSYSELLEWTSKIAGGLRSLGLDKGDRVVIYMPMVPETVVAMLACARIGAVHSVVFGGFAAPELASRIDDAEPKVILSA